MGFVVDFQKCVVRRQNTWYQVWTKSTICGGIGRNGVIRTGEGHSLSVIHMGWCLSSPFHPLREKLTDAFAVAIVAVHRDNFRVENRKLPQNGSRVHSRDTLLHVHLHTPYTVNNPQNVNPITQNWPHVTSSEETSRFYATFHLSVSETESGLICAQMLRQHSLSIISTLLVVSKQFEFVAVSRALLVLSKRTSLPTLSCCSLPVATTRWVHCHDDV
jgi:hypothetical protein